MDDRNPARREGQPELRVSDAERHDVAETLRLAAGEGRLGLDELEERLEAAFAARTYADLEPLTRDLPGHVHARSRPPRDAGRPSPRARGEGGDAAASVSIAVLSGVDRKGDWELGATHTAVAIMGGVDLDLRHAVLPPESVITAVALMGGIDVVVDEYTRVVVDGIGLMGGFDEGRPRAVAQLGASSPVVRVRGLALMGAVQVTRKPREGKGTRLPKGQRRELEE